MKVQPVLLSPRDLAQAMGVSESSIKRWADDGKIMITSTQGGHRKIQREEAVRFIRERGMKVPFPQHLGLGAVSSAEQDEDSLNSRLKAALIESIAKAFKHIAVLTLDDSVGSWAVVRGRVVEPAQHLRSL